jgi:hypothetical protein
VSGANEVKIDPAVLHTVADDHDGVADAIESARAAGPNIAAAVASYGPIMHQFKAAVGDVLGARDAALREHGDEHRAAAENLRLEAAKYVAVDENNADRLRLDR